MKKVLKNNLSVLLLLCFVISALLGVGIILQAQSTTAFAESSCGIIYRNIATYFG